MNVYSIENKNKQDKNMEVVGINFVKQHKPLSAH